MSTDPALGVVLVVHREPVVSCPLAQLGQKITFQPLCSVEEYVWLSASCHSFPLPAVRSGEGLSALSIKVIAFQHALSRGAVRSKLEEERYC